MHKHTTGRRVWGHALPENFWNLEAMRLLLRQFLGQYDASRRPDDRVHMYEYLPFLPIASYNTGFGFPIVH